MQDLVSRHDRPDSPSEHVIARPRTAITWFHAPPATQVGVYTALFPAHMEPTQYVQALRNMQDGGEQGRLWTMLMTAGGHFAGVIVRVCHPHADFQEMTNTRRVKPSVEILRHKTFHRYTSVELLNGMCLLIALQRAESRVDLNQSTTTPRDSLKARVHSCAVMENRL